MGYEPLEHRETGRIYVNGFMFVFKEFHETIPYWVRSYMFAVLSNSKNQLDIDYYPSDENAQVHSQIDLKPELS